MSACYVDLISICKQSNRSIDVHIILTSKDLERSSEEEASALLESKELAEEQEERQEAEDD